MKKVILFMVGVFGESDVECSVSLECYAGSRLGSE